MSLLGSITTVTATELDTIQLDTDQIDTSSTVDASEFVEEQIDVTDIEIEDYENTLEVGGKLTISATILPSDASDQTISYSTSNSAIATVSQTGEIKGKSAGDVKIYISAGTIQKEIDIKVVVSAKGINLNKNYIVLKSGQTHQINASIYPSDTTDKSIEYSVTDNSIATVSNTGLVKAVACGSTSVLVKNSNAIASLTVIVSSDSLKSIEKTKDTPQKEEETILDSISAEEYSSITSEILQQLYNSKTTLCVTGDGYTLKIDGNDIKNTNNPIKTDINLTKVEDGLSFTLNDGENLCGNIIVSINDAEKYNYLYLYNESENKYILLECVDIENINISTSGKYLLTTSNLTYLNIPWVIIFISGGILVILFAVFIILKHRYWFW